MNQNNPALGCSEQDNFTGSVGSRPNKHRKHSADQICCNRVVHWPVDRPWLAAMMLRYAHAPSGDLPMFYIHIQCALQHNDSTTIEFLITI